MRRRAGRLAGPEASGASPKVARLTLGGARCILLLDGSELPNRRRPPGDGQQHEQVPVPLVSRRRARPFSSAEDQHAIPIMHPPFEAPAALGHSHVVHGKRDIGFFDLFPNNSVAAPVDVK